MSETRVIIIGCGIAGPVLATFLKLKGYHPIVYDRIDGVGEAGKCFVLQPNGLRILAQIPGLLEKLPYSVIDEFTVISTVPGHEGVLAKNDGPGKFIQEFGMPIKPVVRTEFHRSLVEVAEQHEIEIKWRHQLTHLEEIGEDSVRVIFANGVSDVGSFVVGCDGLHSNTRIALFGEEKAEYTGLTQVAGITDTPLELQDSHALLQWFGDGAHFLSYRPSKTNHYWVITRKESESKESWREVDNDTQKKVQAELLETWNSGIPKKLIESTGKLVKYGCYDRPRLQTWHKGRVVLVGDAAHPTSPHIGQGANQAFVDAHTLLTSLIRHSPDAISLSTATLETVFTEYENLRISKASEAVISARNQGELRGASGIEECIKRNEIVKAVWGDSARTIKDYRDMYGEAPVNLISS